MTESYSAQFGEGKFKDFRDKLVSIFVDNLSFNVDQRCLWEVFKPFGRVRDVYLSMEKRARRSRFAFVRFETLEEAVKVAKATHGMLVYGWNIATKVASHGWSNRKPFQAKQRIFSFDEEAQYKREGGEQVQRSSVKGQSFVDIVKGQQDRSFKHSVKVKEAEKMMKLSWECRQGEQEWLSRCAVGVLKNFTEVSRVNQRLQDAGFAFSASYLGDKSILWCLDSVAHKEAFIGNRFMWDDIFSAMVRWSESAIPQSRLAWINCWGAPLSCWSPEFFKSLGWKIGEPLLVEEEVEKRNRVDRGRVLVLVPQSKTCSTSILVQIGLKSFVVKLEEDSIPVDFRWTENYLGLMKNQNSAGLGMELLLGVDSQRSHIKEAGHVGTGKSTSSQCLQTGLQTSKAKSGLIDKSKSGLIDKRNSKAARKIKKIGVLAKGKKQWVGKKKKKFSIGFAQNGILNIDKRQCLVRGGTNNSEESSSSSEDSLGISFFKDSFKSRGECSNRQANRVQFLNGGELCVDLGVVEVNSSKLLSHNHLKPILEDVIVEEEERVREEVSEMIDKEANPEELVQASVTLEEDSVNTEPLLPNPASNKKGYLRNGSSINHRMKTRYSSIIEEEVSKVMEVGNLLGLNFSGIEQEVSDVIADREAEDIARMENQ